MIDIEYPILCKRCAGSGFEPSMKELTPEESKAKKRLTKDDFPCIECNGTGKVLIKKTGIEKLLIKMDLRSSIKNISPQVLEISSKKEE